MEIIIILKSLTEISLYLFALFGIIVCVCNLVKEDFLELVGQKINNLLKPNNLKKLVGRKAYRQIMKSENQIAHAFDYLQTIYPEYPNLFEGKEKTRLNKFTIEYIAEQILDNQKL